MKLSEFKGVLQLSGGAFTKDLRRVTYSAYDMNKVDGAVYIDTRVFKKEIINLDLQIVESGRMDLVYRFPDSQPQMSIFTQMNPWLVVQFW